MLGELSGQQCAKAGSVGEVVMLDFLKDGADDSGAESSRSGSLSMARTTSIPLISRR